VVVTCIKFAKNVKKTVDSFFLDTVYIKQQQREIIRHAYLLIVYSTIISCKIVQFYTVCSVSLAIAEFTLLPLVLVF